jgi:chromosomal replication initiator protein
MTSQEIWSGVLADLQLSLSKPVYEFYLKKMGLLEIDEAGDEFVATVACPSAFMMNEVEKRILPQIKAAFEIVVTRPCQIKLKVNDEINKREWFDQPLFSEGSFNRQDEIDRVMRKSGLSRELSLETYAVSSSNEMAYAAAQAVSQNPGSAYNPLFLYGGVGVGKTHLMQGVGQTIVKKNLEVKIIYCTGEEFTNGIIEAIQQKSTTNFKKKFRSVNLLLIDDVQFIAGKTAVQEEFFHTFNAILKGGGQIIMTSDKPPIEIDALEERLRSRFEGGLTIDIGQPDFELRSAILMIKAKQMGLDIPIEVARVIAEEVKNTRGLLGALMKVKTIMLAKKDNLDPELIRKTLGVTNSGKRDAKQVRPLDVIKTVAEYYNAQIKDIRGNRRVKTLVLPRHVAMYILKFDLDLGLVEIGSWFSNRDHTTVIHAVDKVDQLIKQGNKIGEDIVDIRKKMLIS